MNTKKFALITLFLPFVAYAKDGQPHPIAKYWTIGLETAAAGYAIPTVVATAGNVYNKEILKAAFTNPRFRAASYAAGLALSVFNTKYSDTPYCNVVGGYQLPNKLIFAGCIAAALGARDAHLNSNTMYDIVLTALRTPVQKPRLVGACFLMATATYAVKNSLFNIPKVFKSKQ